MKSVQELKQQEEALRSAENALGSELRGYEALLRRFKEADNAYNGFARSLNNPSSWKVVGLESKVESLKAEVQRLRDDLSATENRANELRKTIDALKESIAAAQPGAVLELRQSEYREQYAKLAELTGQAGALEDELKAAQQELNKAQLALTSAQAEKRKALCVADVAAATKTETAAQSRVEDLLTLIGNIETEKGKLSAERERLGKSLAQVETALWSVRASLMLEELRRSPDFVSVSAALQRLYIATGKTGHSYNAPPVSAFLTNVFGEWSDAEWRVSIGQELAAEFGILQ